MAFEDTLQAPAGTPGPGSLLPPSSLMQQGANPVEGEGTAPFDQYGPEAEAANQPQQQPGGATLGDVMPAQLKQAAAAAQASVAKAKQANQQATQTKAQYLRTLGQHALQAAGGIVSSLGDAAAVGTVPLGGGAAGALARTFGARQERVRQQSIDEQNRMKNEALIAEANTRRIHEQRLSHQLGEQNIQASVNQGLKQAAVLRSGAIPALEKAKGLTYDQIPNAIRNKAFDLGGDVALPTGTKVIGEDPQTHEPITAATYSIFSVPQTVKLDPKNDQQKQEIDTLNKYSQFPKQENADGTVTMTGPQYIAFRQQANDLMTVENAANEAFVANNVATEKRAISDEGKEFLLDAGHDLQKAMVAAPKDAAGMPNLIWVRNALQPKYNHIDSDMAIAFPERWKTYVDIMEKQMLNAADSYNNLLKKYRDADTGAKTLSAQFDIDEALGKTNLSPEQRQALMDARKAASDKYAALDQRERELAEEKKEPALNDTVYAYNSQTKRLEAISNADYLANSGGKGTNAYSGRQTLGKDSAKKLGDDSNLSAQLSAVQAALSRYEKASTAYEQAARQETPTQRNAEQAVMGQLLEDDKLKVHLLGLELPVDYLNYVRSSANWAKMSTPAQQEVEAFLSMRAAIPIYTRALTNSSRNSDKIMHLEDLKIPSPIDPIEVRMDRIKNFQDDIDMRAGYLPKIQGVEHPSEVRQRLAQQGFIPQADKENAAATIRNHQSGPDGQFQNELTLARKQAQPGWVIMKTPGNRVIFAKTPDEVKKFKGLGAEEVK